MTRFAHAVLALMVLVPCMQAQRPEQRPGTAGAAADSSGCAAFDILDSGSVRPPSSTRVSGEAQGTASPRPSIILLASASAREIRFAAQPRITVRLCGASFDSVRVVERRNLPRPVQPGVTYRDVFIAVEILGHLNARCLAERITGQGGAGELCASLSLRDSAAVTRPPERGTAADRPPR